MLFLSLYLYVLAWQSDNLKKAITFGFGSGILTGLLALAWGGVAFVTLIISLFLLVELLLYRFTKKDFYIYTAWIVPSFIFILSSSKYGGIFGVTSMYFYAIPLFVFVISLVNYFAFDLNILNLKEQLKDKIPLGVASFFISLILVFVISGFIFSFSYIPTQIGSIITDFFSPQGTTRFQLTVAEGQAPHFDDWLSGSAFGVNIPYLSWIYFSLFFLGSTLLFYDFIKPIRKRKLLTIIYVLFLASFIFSNYMPGSILNGKTLFSRVLYAGSILVFTLIMVGGYIYSFYKNKQLFKEIMLLDKKYVFLFIWFFLMIITVRGALRIFFVFAPVTAILASYMIINLIDFNLKLEKNNYKLAIWIALIIISYAVFSSFLTTTLSTSKYTGLSYDNQWQNAEKWVKANTSENAVFSHWWDYGYWIQTGFNRATVLDGGNYIVYWNHLFGRHVLTGSNITRALEFLKTHKANYLLIDPSDIGKYPAYASIGSDANYDRLSQIPVFGLDTKQIQETRNETIYLYRGGFGLDEDLIYQGKVFPRGGAAVVGVFLPLIKEENTSNMQIAQPIAAVFYNNEQFRLRLSCAYVNDVEFDFKDAELEGCLRIIPTIEGNQMNPLGAAYYLSPKVRKTFFAQLYLLKNNQIEPFKLVYSDEKDVPLAIYNGRSIGPLKIWEINYPENIKENPDDLKTDFPSAELYRV